MCYAYYRWRIQGLELKLGFSIASDVFDYGLVIPHYGTIVVGSGNKIGKYAVLHSCICITQKGSTIGDGFYCSTGAKVTGTVTIGNYCSVAANSVVTKSFPDNKLLVGMPAFAKADMEAWWLRDGQKYTARVEAVEALRKKMGLAD